MIEQKKVANKAQIIADYLTGSGSFKAMELKYGVKARTIQTWVRAYKLKNPSISTAPENSDDIRSLKKQLATAQLKNELLEELLRLSEEQTGLDLRKKTGTRQS